MGTWCVLSSRLHSPSSMSNKSTMILFSGLALVVGNTFPYTLLGLGAASLTVYAVNRQTPSAKLGRVEDVIMVTEGSSTTRKGKRCKRPTLKYQCQYSNSLLEARSIKTWGEYLEKIKEILQSIDECAKEVKAIQTSILLTIETERRRQLYEGIKEVRETIDVTIVLRYLWTLLFICYPFFLLFFCAGYFHNNQRDGTGVLDKHMLTVGNLSCAVQVLCGLCRDQRPGLGSGHRGCGQENLRPKLHLRNVTLSHLDMFILDNWFLSDVALLLLYSTNSSGVYLCLLSSDQGAPFESCLFSGWREGEETKLADAEASDSDGQQHAYGQYGADTSGLRSLQRWTRQHSRSKERWRLELRAVNSLRPSRRPTRSGCIASECGESLQMLGPTAWTAHGDALEGPAHNTFKALRLALRSHIHPLTDYGFSFGFSPAPTSHGSSDGRRPIVYRLSVAIESRIFGAATEQLLRRYIIPHRVPQTESQARTKFTARPLVDQFCGPPIRGGIVQLACTNIVTRQIEGKSLALGITTCTPQPTQPNSSPLYHHAPPRRLPAPSAAILPAPEADQPTIPVSGTPRSYVLPETCTHQEPTVRNFLYRQKFNAPVPASAGNASLLSNKFGASGLCVFSAVH
ncbi:hypothetical protein B0H14DRAFT_3746720 [Mycena olivaceomarginata]|nr:hypothetical protein B0H14DRAFT_3746720 [Mycena olivaceomarginata]